MHRFSVTLGALALLFITASSTLLAIDRPLRAQVGGNGSFLCNACSFMNGQYVCSSCTSVYPSQADQAEPANDSFADPMPGQRATEKEGTCEPGFAMVCQAGGMTGETACTCEQTSVTAITPAGTAGAEGESGVCSEFIEQRCAGLGEEWTCVLDETGVEMCVEKDEKELPAANNFLGGCTEESFKQCTDLGPGWGCTMARGNAECVRGPSGTQALGRTNSGDSLIRREQNVPLAPSVPVEPALRPAPLAGLRDCSSVWSFFCTLGGYEGCVVQEENPICY